MKNLEIRVLWLQRDVGMNRVIIHKVDGTQNPADLMTKYVKRWEIEVRLDLMGMTVVWDPDVKEEDKEELAKEVYMIGRSFVQRSTARQIRRQRPLHYIACVKHESALFNSLTVCLRSHGR